MSSEQLMAGLGMDDEMSGVFSMAEILSGPEIESGMLDDLDEDDWPDLSATGA